MSIKLRTEHLNDDARLNKAGLVVNDGILYTRHLILRLMCGAYIIAFSAFYYQSRGLFGANGILPASIYTDTTTSTLTAFIKTPTLLHFGFIFGLDTEYTMDLIGILGIFLSILGFISIKLCVIPLFATLWVLYFSLYQITDIFGHQSDQLLLEAGFVCIALAPLYSNRHSTQIDKIVLVLLKWILFRFIFESGCVKIISRCPKWWKLTAFESHFETLPLPTALAYYTHNLPLNILKAINIISHASELAVPWLFFFPHRALTQIVFYWQIYVQLGIILTGNYGLQPILIIILSFSLLDDDFFYGKELPGILARILKGVLILNLIFLVAALSLSSFYMPLEITPDFLKYLIKILPTAPALALIILFLTAFGNLIYHPIKAYSKTMAQRLYFVNTTIGFTILSALLIVISMVPFGYLDNSTNINHSNLGDYYETIKKFHVINQYGLDLRKIRSERIEIIYEHSQSIEGPWTEYNYLYRPWNRNQSLPFTGPYLPRLDYRFYGAASTTFRDNLWTASMAYRLLQNNPNILKLLGIGNPIEPPPIFVRAGKYRFWYTSIDTKKSYWIKAIRGEYLPAASLDNPLLMSYIRSLKISVKQHEGRANSSILQTLLDYLRQQAYKCEGTIFTCTIITSAIAIVLLNNVRAKFKQIKKI